MGNIILCCIKYQLRVTRGITFEACIKRCSTCGLLQFTPEETCHSCGRPCGRLPEVTEDDLLQAQAPPRAMEMDAVLSAIESLQSCLERKSLVSDAGKKLVIEGALESVQCPICLEPFSNALTLPCGHSLCTRHTTAVRNMCPICREGFRGSLTRNVVLCRHVDTVLENLDKLQTKCDAEAQCQT